jgi:hypothetical protein
LLAKAEVQGIAGRLVNTTNRSGFRYGTVALLCVNVMQGIMQMKQGADAGWQLRFSSNA